MKKIYFTLTGTKYFHGKEFLEPGMRVILEKEKDNEYDSEAILVKLEGLGAIGHVANSSYTVKGASFSAGRIYDKIGDTAYGTIMYVLDDGVLCSLDGNFIKDERRKKHPSIKVRIKRCIY